MMEISQFNETLATAISPITLISGVGLLMICMTGRYNHATNRIRLLMAKRKTAASHFEPVIDAEIDLILRRASFLRKGMLCIALSAVFSALLVTSSTVATLSGIDLTTYEAFFLVLAITLIVISSLLFSAEISLSLKALKLAIDNLPDRDFITKCKN